MTDLSSLVMKFKALKPDVVVATCYLNDAILFNRQSKEMNFYVKALVGGEGGTEFWTSPKPSAMTPTEFSARISRW